MELCNGGELAEHYLDKDGNPYFSEESVKHLIRRLANAVIYLHERGMLLLWGGSIDME